MGQVERLQTNDLELGITDAVKQHITRNVAPSKPVTQARLDFEYNRPRWLRECFAEATGVFMFCFPGLASVASFILNADDEFVITAYGSIFQVGWAFGLGIAFAIITCGPTSGGHFNPAITLNLAYWQGFPWPKVPYYILSQIVGAFAAACLVTGMYWVQIQEYRAALEAAGDPIVAAGSLANILVAIPGPTQTNKGYLFMIEFFVDAFIAFLIWAVLDPANPFVSPAGAPFLIGMVYAVMIWAFGDITISTNLARDLGARIAAVIFFGRAAFTIDGGYAAIGILVNIPATFLGVTYYELVMRDSIKGICGGHLKHKDGDEGLTRHITKHSLYDLERQATKGSGSGRSRRSEGSSPASPTSPTSTTGFIQSGLANR
ncbi:aquaporin-like protein [Diplogelasinospora grovesii]|uniref:Aquaporin-like protein n=1 Tax=Diplogelasinospora grovesii TaxID=303347 RepID=A0AAN6N288_9PEZI|nr:aquaporin-like protein [Diplogelasinospora grovesii]